MSRTPAPVALYGALRSGTTMFRLMLGHHPALHNPGETDFLLDFISPDPSHPTGWRYDRAALEAHRIFRDRNIDLPDGADGLDLLHAMIDAMAAQAPGKRLVLVFHRNAERLAQLMPEMQILHLLRDPRDVARSAVGMGWAGNAYRGVDTWLSAEKGWEAAGIRADRALTVRFEVLIADIEAELARVCDFLGLDYDRAMLGYADNSTYDLPDPAKAGNWRGKLTPREVARLDARAGPLLTARGYELSGDPVAVGPLEETLLGVQHRFRRWRHNIRRYGLWSFTGLHLSRLLGLKDMSERLHRQQEAIRIQELK